MQEVIPARQAPGQAPRGVAMGVVRVTGGRAEGVICLMACLMVMLRSPTNSAAVEARVGVAPAMLSTVEPEVAGPVWSLEESCTWTVRSPPMEAMGAENTR